MNISALRRYLPAALLALLSLSSTAAPPISTADNYPTAEDTALNVPTATGVLANDNANGNPQIQAVLMTPPAHGIFTLNPDGSFTFTPAQDYNGPDSFTYKARSVPQPIAFDIDPAQSNSTITV